MAVKKTATGYQIWYYDADGKFRKQIAKGVTRKRAEQIEREIRYKVDHGEEIIDTRRRSCGGARSTRRATRSRRTRAGRWRGTDVDRADAGPQDPGDALRGLCAAHSESHEA
jgi:hypothetical protein